MPEPIQVEVQDGSPPPPRATGPGFLLFLPGLFFIGLGLAVLLVPALLKVMVSAAFFLVGLGLCFGAMRLRRASLVLTRLTQDYPGAAGR